MDKLYLIGEDVRASGSKKIYENLALTDGIDLNYTLVSLSEKELGNFVEKVKSENYRGFNVTAPYKTKIIEYIDELSEEAKRIGAVNTVVNEQGVLKGYNTDIYGIKYGIEPFLEAGKTLILGRGGAARALVDTLRDYELYVYARDDKSNQGILSINDKVKIVNDLNDRGYVNVINATNVGFNSKEYIITKPFSEQICAVDLIYTPEKTTFLNFMEDAGLDVLNGYPMLEHQAKKAYQLFYDKKGEIDG